MDGAARAAERVPRATAVAKPPEVVYPLRAAAAEALQGHRQVGFCIMSSRSSSGREGQQRQQQQQLMVAVAAASALAAAASYRGPGWSEGEGAWRRAPRRHVLQAWVPYFAYQLVGGEEVFAALVERARFDGVVMGCRQFGSSSLR